MKRNMRYNYVFTREGKEPEVSIRRNRACFYALYSIPGVLNEIHWDFDHESGITREEFIELFTYLFTTGEQYGVQFEIGESYKDELNKPFREEFKDTYESDSIWTPVKITNLGNYPRNLMMNKLFMIRNLGRYNFHYKLYKHLREKEVQMGVAAYIGANFQKKVHLNALAEDSYYLITYAESLQSSARLCEIRNAALCNHKLITNGGRPWNLGGGYDGVCSAINTKAKVTQFRSKNLGSFGGFNNGGDYKASVIDKILNSILKKKRPKKFLVA